MAGCWRSLPQPLRDHADQHADARVSVFDGQQDAPPLLVVIQIGWLQLGKHGQDERATGCDLNKFTKLLPA